MDLDRAIEFILEQQAKVEANLASITAREDRAAERVDKEMAGMRAYMRHAVQLAIREARAERRKRREMDDRWEEHMTRLAAAQLVTEERLNLFIDSMRRGGNGHPPV